VVAVEAVRALHRIGIRGVTEAGLLALAVLAEAARGAVRVDRARRAVRVARARGRHELAVTATAGAAVVPIGAAVVVLAAVVTASEVQRTPTKGEYGRDEQAERVELRHGRSFLWRAVVVARSIGRAIAATRSK